MIDAEGAGKERSFRLRRSHHHELSGPRLDKFFGQPQGQMKITFVEAVVVDHIGRVHVSATPFRFGDI